MPFGAIHKGFSFVGAESAPEPPSWRRTPAVMPRLTRRMAPDHPSRGRCNRAWLRFAGADSVKPWCACRHVWAKNSVCSLGKPLWTFRRAYNFTVSPMSCPGPGKKTVPFRAMAHPVPVGGVSGKPLPPTVSSGALGRGQKFPCGENLQCLCHRGWLEQDIPSNHADMP